MKLPLEAWQLLEPHLQPLEAEPVARRDAAGRVLAEDLVATVDVPPFAVSAMDGYALTGETSVGSRLTVAATVAAGDPPGLRQRPGTAISVMTGAPVPEGADRVIPVEATDRGRETVEIQAPANAGDHIRLQGEVTRAGAALLPRGTLLTQGSLSLIASHGLGAIQAIRTPTVGVITTGNELVPADTNPAPGQLRDSHSDFLWSAASALGCRVRLLGIARDEPEALTRLVTEGLSSDVLLLSGGVSAGEFDFVEGVLGALGCDLLFDAVAIQPGKPMVAARHAGGLVFGLPGNPASAMVTFWLFVRPALRRLQGLHDGFWHGALDGTLTAELPGAKGRDRFLPADVRFEAGGILVRPLVPQGSHDVAAYGLGTAIVRVPARSQPAPPGAPCQILPLADWRSPVEAVERLQGSR